MVIVNKKLSLTAVAGNFKGMGVTRDDLRDCLIADGFILDMKTITDKGLQSGISYKYNYEGARWPVYDCVMQKYLRDHVTVKPKKETAQSRTSQSKKIDSKQQASVTPAADAANVTVETQPSANYVKPVSLREDGKYPYLQLPRFVVLDTESTGLTKDDEMIEIGILSDSGRTLFNARYCPEKEVNYYASKVNHLTKEQLKDYPKFTKSAWDEIKKAIGGKIIVGHNIRADKRFIKQTLLRYHIEDDTETVFAGMIDTQDLARKWLKAESYSLDRLTTLIGIDREEQHEALDDSRMTLELVDRLEDVINIRKTYNFVYNK